MSSFKTLFTSKNMSSAAPEVMISQIAAFSKQVPLLYVIGNVNSFALAYTHFDSAPKLLTLIVPIPMMALCLLRILVWFKTPSETFTAEAARARLRTTIVMTAILGGIYAAWALCLYPYGDAYARCHVAFFMATTVIGTIFCLMHLRAAALLLAAVVTIPFMIRFLTTGQPVLTAMALDFLLIVVIVVFLLSKYYKDFTDLVNSQVTLAALSNENLRIAHQDSLTGLPNRRSFFADVTTVLDHGLDDGTMFALALIDLDGFKPVNDVFGHNAGDRVLIEVGRRLRQTLGPNVLVARLGGDEFGLLLTLPSDESDVVMLGTMICEEVQRPIHVNGGIARVAASIGFAFRSNAAATLEPLLERADYALYCAKTHQRGTAVLFSAQHETAISSKSLIEQELRLADLDAEMSLKFQPIVNVAKQKTIAYEALARWHSPRLGHVPPTDFIAAAERMGLINQLTETLFAKALAAMKTWPRDIDLSFNLSVRDLSCSDSMARIVAMIEASGIKARRIGFEVTESALVHDFDQMREVLLSLKAMGARIALDDFGTGFASLAYVHRLPFDKIKVDRGFVQDITTNQASHDIVKSIVDLCRNLKVTCVVEGVETQGQVLMLRLLGCTTMQGYFFGRPADNADLSATGKGVAVA